MKLPDSPLTRENYFTYTHHEGMPIIHSSALEHIYPGQGGTLKRLKMFLDGEMEEPKTSYRTFGSLFHSYMENKNTFVVEPAVRPEEGVVKVVTHMFENFPEGSPIPRLPASFSLLGELMFSSARAVPYQSKWGQDAIVKKISAEGADYWKFLCEALGHYMLTAKQKEQLEGATQSVKDSQWAEIVFRKDAMHEVPVLFKWGDIWCKALLDWVVVPASTSKTVYVIDYKTTSKPVGTFFCYETMGFGDEGVKSEWAPGAFWYYNYHRQMAFYRKAAAELQKQIRSTTFEPSTEVSILAIESEVPFECRLESIGVDALNVGQRAINICLPLIGDYYKTLKKY